MRERRGKRKELHKSIIEVLKKKKKKNILPKENRYIKTANEETGNYILFHTTGEGGGEKKIGRWSKETFNREFQYRVITHAKGKKKSRKVFRKRMFLFFLLRYFKVM